MSIKNNYKIRYYGVLFVLPIMLFLCWKVAVKQSVDNYKEIRELEKVALNFADAEQVLSSLKLDLNKLNKKGTIKADEVDDFLMDIISKNVRKYSIALENIPEKISEEKTNYTMQTYSITFSGSYISLVKFIHFLESELTGGRIISVNFFRTNKRKVGEKLFMELYYQVIFNNKKL